MMVHMTRAQCLALTDNPSLMLHMMIHSTPSSFQPFYVAGLICRHWRAGAARFHISDTDVPKALRASPP